MKYPTNYKLVYKIILGVLVLGICGAAQAQAPQGFISRLIQIKYSTELYLTMEHKSEKKDSALALYNTLRWKVDGLVYQLSTKMITHNSPHLMRQLNAWSYDKTKKAPKSIQYFIKDIEAIEAVYAAEVLPKIYPNLTNNRTLNLTTNVFYLLKDSYTIIKGLSDMKTRKVMALVELLDHTRFLGPGEVGKMVK